LQQIGFAVRQSEYMVSGNIANPKSSFKKSMVLEHCNQQGGMYNIIIIIIILTSYPAAMWPLGQLMVPTSSIS
jgi:hypothetical protein